MAGRISRPLRTWCARPVVAVCVCACVCLCVTSYVTRRIHLPIRRTRRFNVCSCSTRRKRGKPTSPEALPTRSVLPQPAQRPRSCSLAPPAPGHRDPSSCPSLFSWSRVSNPAYPRGFVCVARVRLNAQTPRELCSGGRVPAGGSAACTTFRTRHGLRGPAGAGVPGRAGGCCCCCCCSLHRSSPCARRPLSGSRGGWDAKRQGPYRKPNPLSSAAIHREWLLPIPHVPKTWSPPDDATRLPPACGHRNPR